MATHAVALDLMTLLDVPGVGPSRARKLLRGWQFVRDSESPLESSCLRNTLSPAQIAALPVSTERAMRQWDELSRRNVHILPVIDPIYPETLKRTLADDSPLLLLCLGNLDLLKKISVGFCGSREATEKGVSTTRDAADLLAHEGVNIVSGFAAGVDMGAHRAALIAGGSTTVVLAEGILRFRVKKEIRREWDDQRTLVVSEFGPELPWNIGRAMQRNRTICGLSRAMILIESRASGGSIQAGRDCLKLGLPLFAAVYEGMPESAVGNQQLLQQGASRLMKSRFTNRTNIKPILEALATNARSRARGPISPSEGLQLSNPSPDHA